jgi:hypothetical protein
MAKERVTPPVRSVPDEGGVKSGEKSALTTPTFNGDLARNWTDKTKPTGKILGRGK